MSRVKYDREVFNIDRLRAAVAWAEIEAAKGEDDSQWDQGVWVGEGELGRGRRITTFNEDPEFQNTYGPDRAKEVKVRCGTAFCVAGWACHAEGDKFVAVGYDYYGDFDIDPVPDYAVPKGSNTAYDIGERARMLLGITDEEANELFAGNNSIQDVRRIARKIARRRGERL